MDTMMQLELSPIPQEHLGVYIGARVCEHSRNQLLEFCQKNGINLKDGKTQYERRLHCTVMYAAKNQFDANMQRMLLQTIEGQSFKAIPNHWVILKSPNTNQNCLALKLDCDPLNKFHRELTDKLSLAHSFKDYTTHVSLHYNFSEPLPEIIPDFEIELKDLYVKPLYHS